MERTVWMYLRLPLAGLCSCAYNCKAQLQTSNQHTNMLSIFHYVRVQQKKRKKKKVTLAEIYLGTLDYLCGAHLWKFVLCYGEVKWCQWLCGGQETVDEGNWPSSVLEDVKSRKSVFKCLICQNRLKHIQKTLNGIQ